MHVNADRTFLAARSRSIDRRSPAAAVAAGDVRDVELALTLEAIWYGAGPWWRRLPGLTVVM